MDVEDLGFATYPCKTRNPDDTDVLESTSVTVPPLRYMLAKHIKTGKKYTLKVRSKKQIVSMNLQARLRTDEEGEGGKPRSVADGKSLTAARLESIAFELASGARLPL